MRTSLSSLDHTFLEFKPTAIIESNPGKVKATL
jgi:hypothetical protein